MEHVKVSENLNTFKFGKHKDVTAYLITIKFITDKELQFYFSWMELNVFQECLSAGKIFRLSYLENNDSVLVNPSAITIVVQEPKELTNG